LVVPVAGVPVTYVTGTGLIFDQRHYSCYISLLHFPELTDIYIHRSWSNRFWLPHNHEIDRSTRSRGF